MSKAFTRERDDEPDEDIAEPKLPPAGTTRYITTAGYRALELELEGLVRVERPKVARAVADTVAQGDRSDNAEHLYDKRRLRQVDGRIRYLSGLLERLTVVVPDPAQAGCVFFGAVVTVEDEDGKRTTYKIVGPDETDLEAGKISVESPVAKALLSRRVGDEATVMRPKGPTELAVIAIRYDDR